MSEMVEILQSTEEGVIGLLYQNGEFKAYKEIPIIESDMDKKAFHFKFNLELEEKKNG